VTPFSKTLPLPHPIAEGDLFKLRTTPTLAENLLRSANRGWTERHIFLFDHLLVVCKPLSNGGSTGGSKGSSGGSGSTEPTYKFKSKFYIRKSDIFDVEDDDEEVAAVASKGLFKNAFKITTTAAASGGGGGNYTGDESTIVLFCSTADEKEDWMTSLVEMQTAGVLHRMLEAYVKEEERRVPLMVSSFYRVAQKNPVWDFSQEGYSF